MSGKGVPRTSVRRRNARSALTAQMHTKPPGSFGTPAPPQGDPRRHALRVILPCCPCRYRDKEASHGTLFCPKHPLYGFDRARWRGLWKVAIQEYLVSAIQNIETLLRYGRKPTKGVRSSPFATLGMAVWVHITLSLAISEEPSHDERFYGPVPVTGARGIGLPVTRPLRATGR